MHVPQWLKPGFWGICAGALGIMILGFAWGGWVLGSTAEKMASERAGAAVTAVLVPICVDGFMKQTDAAARLAEFQKTASWQQNRFIEESGWATAPGTQTPNSAVAGVCAKQLVKIST